MMGIKIFNSIFKIIWLLLVKECSGQPVANPKLICQLPFQIVESSGLIVWSANIFYSHGDSGNDAVLYAFDSLGVLKDSLPIMWAQNVDWEDLAFSRSDSLVYIGDFGNNSNSRTDLVIYKCKAHPGYPLIDQGKISLSYADQQSFPATANFDMEAFFVDDDSLFLFSKNTFPGGTGFSKLYKLPSDTGTHIAQLIDSIFTYTPITSADINQDGSRVALLSYGKIVLLYGFQGNNYFAGNKIEIGIPLSQTEAIAFGPNGILYLTNESGKLFSLDIEPIILGKKIVWQDKFLKVVYPNPAHNSIRIAVPSNSKIQFTLYNMEGKMIFNKDLAFSSEITLPNLAQGIYIYNVISDGKEFSGRLKIN